MDIANSCTLQLSTIYYVELPIFEIQGDNAEIEFTSDTEIALNCINYHM